MDVGFRFAELLAADDDGFPLDEACLLVAAHANPGLDIAALLASLDRIAEMFPGGGSEALIAHLLGPGGFTGNTAEYYDAANSLLDLVIARRTGIPITLAVVAIEVGRRVGVQLVGVGMPGHFLVRDARDPTVYFDPFHGPSPVTAADCRRLYHAVAGQRARFSESYLDPVSGRAIVTRILTNLKVVYQRRSDLASLGWVMRLRAAVPGLGEAERDERRRMFAVLN